jgi:hypothetical protein
MRDEENFMKKLTKIRQMADCPMTFTVGYRGKWELLDIKFYPAEENISNEPEFDVDYVG